MRSTTTKIPRAFLCASTLALALTFSAWAQNGPIRSVTTYHVKSDRVADYQAAIKEYNAVLKKASYGRGDMVFVSTTGPIEYVRVISYPKWADMDVNVASDPKLKEYSADLTRIGTRIVQCTDHSSRILLELMPELSLPGSGAAPKMVRVLRIRVKPDKVSEFLAMQKDDVLPAVRKAGAKDYSTARVRAGAPSTEYHVVTPLNAWAELSSRPLLLEGMGDAAYRSFLAKTTALQVESEYNIYRYMPDLSYQPSAK